MSSAGFTSGSVSDSTMGLRLSVMDAVVFGLVARSFAVVGGGLLNVGHCLVVWGVAVGFKARHNDL